MSFVEEIFKKATIRGVADYLLFGLAPDEETRDYEGRLNETYLAYEKVVFQYNESETSDLLDLANAMTSETASVYIEIGLQAGILLMQDMLQNIKENSPIHRQTTSKRTYEELEEYVTLALKLMQESEDEKVKKARELLNRGVYQMSGTDAD